MHATKRLRKAAGQPQADQTSAVVADDDEYVDPAKAFHSVGEEEYTTVVQPPAADVQQPADDNSTGAEEYVDPAKDFHEVNVMRSDSDDQAFQMGSDDKYVEPSQAFHTVTNEPQYLPAHMH
jgi:hypothetical protein